MFVWEEMLRSNQSFPICFEHTVEKKLESSINVVDFKTIAFNLTNISSHCGDFTILMVDYIVICVELIVPKFQIHSTNPV